jgi:hypothetical protein
MILLSRLSPCSCEVLNSDVGANSRSVPGWNQNRPSQYQSSTIFENATPDEVRDFFGDDEFRMTNKWDDMLISYETLEECHTTGTMKVHWVRKVEMVLRWRISSMFCHVLSL